MKQPPKHQIPKMEECLALMSKYEMPIHVVRHSLAVCGVALYLGRRLLLEGLRLDLDLVRSGALLHDITKAYSFNRPLDHSLTGSKLLRKMGYPLTASIVRQHVRISRARSPGEIDEAVVVNYADKRVLEDQVISLEKRVEYIVERYGRDQETRLRIKKNIYKIFQIESEIYAVLPEDPASLTAIDLERECQIP